MKFTITLSFPKDYNDIDIYNKLRYKYASSSFINISREAYPETMLVTIIVSLSPEFIDYHDLVPTVQWLENQVEEDKIGGIDIYFESNISFSEQRVEGYHQFESGVINIENISSEDNGRVLGYKVTIISKRIEEFMQMYDRFKQNKLNLSNPIPVKSKS